MRPYTRELEHEQSTYEPSDVVAKGGALTTRLHSSITFRLHESTFCGIRWMVSVTQTAQDVQKNGRVEALGLTRKSPFLLLTFVEL